MCFKIKSNNRFIEANIAKKDIIVWKSIKKDGYGWMYNLRINEKIEPWTKGYEYTETYFPKQKKHDYKHLYYDTLFIFNFDENGFHSKKMKRVANNITQYNEKVVKMIIPKGSYYYENEEEYFSESLIYPK
jgi:hypothetical protein